MALAVSAVAAAVPVPALVVILDFEGDEEVDPLVYAYPRSAECLQRASQTKGLLLALHGLMRSISGQAVTTTSLDVKGEGEGRIGTRQQCWSCD
jgi:hypothetical protein